MCGIKASSARPVTGRSSARTSKGPDVVLMDIRMPGMGRRRGTAWLTAGLQPPRVLVVTTVDLEEYGATVFDPVADGAVSDEDARRIITRPRGEAV